MTEAYSVEEGVLIVNLGECTCSADGMPEGPSGEDGPHDRDCGLFELGTVGDVVEDALARLCAAGWTVATALEGVRVAVAPSEGAA